jgi:hypothetical protein
MNKITVGPIFVCFAVQLPSPVQPEVLLGCYVFFIMAFRSNYDLHAPKFHFLKRASDFDDTSSGIPSPGTTRFKMT